jgi:hypothetical protein
MGQIDQGKLAEALDCFHNVALGAARQYGADMAIVSAIVEGVNAVAARLREQTKPEFDEAQWIEKFSFIAEQKRETVRQAAAGVNIRLGTMPCRCGATRAVLFMYQCLYCSEWYCKPCAEQHFGKTVAQYRAENPLPPEVKL